MMPTIISGSAVGDRLTLAQFHGSSRSVTAFEAADPTRHVLVWQKSGVQEPNVRYAVTLDFCRAAAPTVHWPKQFTGPSLTIE